MLKFVFKKYVNKNPVPIVFILYLGDSINNYISPAGGFGRFLFKGSTLMLADQHTRLKKSSPASGEL